MDFLKKIKWTPVNVLKGFGVVLLAAFALGIVLRVLAPITEPLLSNTKRFALTLNDASTVSAPGGMAYAMGGANDDYAEAAYDEGGDFALSARNIAPPSPEPPTEPDGTVGDDAEDYEVTDYYASIETRRDASAVCGEVKALKTKDWVVFENANEHERGCSYAFKVARDHVAEILAFIEELDPKDLSENTRTIKARLDDYTSETEILEKKLASVNETLEDALASYDEISAVATRTQNAEALATIIDSKIRLIERLSQQRISINAQLERLARSKAEQLDRLDYTRFYVSVYENKFIDGEDIADSWKDAVRRAVREVNEIVQELTVGLIALALAIVQYALYAVILVLVIKYLWLAAKWIWKK